MAKRKAKKAPSQPLRRLTEQHVLDIVEAVLESLVKDVQAVSIVSTGEEWPDLLETYYAARDALRKLGHENRFPNQEWVVLDVEGLAVARYPKEEFDSADAATADATARGCIDCTCQLVAEQEEPNLEAWNG